MARLILLDSGQLGLIVRAAISSSAVDMSDAPLRELDAPTQARSGS